jgi:hypothetical protein
MEKASLGTVSCTPSRIRPSVKVSDTPVAFALPSIITSDVFHQGLALLSSNSRFLNFQFFRGADAQWDEQTGWYFQP